MSVIKVTALHTLQFDNETKPRWLKDMSYDCRHDGGLLWISSETGEHGYAISPPYDELREVLKFEVSK